MFVYLRIMLRLINEVVLVFIDFIDFINLYLYFLPNIRLFLTRMRDVNDTSKNAIFLVITAFVQIILKSIICTYRYISR